MFVSKCFENECNPSRFTRTFYPFHDQPCLNDWGYVILMKNAAFWHGFWKVGVRSLLERRNYLWDFLASQVLKRLSKFYVITAVIPWSAPPPNGFGGGDSKTCNIHCHGCRSWKVENHWLRSIWTGPPINYVTLFSKIVRRPSRIRNASNLGNVFSERNISSTNSRFYLKRFVFTIRIQKNTRRSGVY